MSSKKVDLVKSSRRRMPMVLGVDTGDLPDTSIYCILQAGPGDGCTVVETGVFHMPPEVNAERLRGIYVPVDAESGQLPLKNDLRGFLERWVKAPQVPSGRKPGLQDYQIRILKDLSEEGEIRRWTLFPRERRSRNDVLYPPLGRAFRTPRGFEAIEFRDCYHNACSIQQSSSAEEDRLWLGIEDACPRVMASEAASLGVVTDKTCGLVPYPIPAKVLLSTRMHLGRTQVQSLVNTLNHWLETGSLSPVVVPTEECLHEVAP